VTAAECYVNRCTNPGDATGRFAGMCTTEHQPMAARIVDNNRFGKEN
jgi:hypothetical protein